MEQMMPGLIMGFREGLEAFLLIAIIIKYISNSNYSHLQSKVIQGSSAGVILSLMIGMLLNAVSNFLGGIDPLTKAWESLASLIALVLVTMFIFWMMRHGNDMSRHVKGQLEKNFSPGGLFLISFVIIAREGTEISMFSFAGKYPIYAVAIGILASILLTILIFYSLVKINISLLFNITLAYLVLQAAYLLGYALHEGLSMFKAYGMIPGESALLIKAFDASRTIFNHNDGVIGIPLHVLFGWYSKPEWIQFIAQHLYIFFVFSFWFFGIRKQYATK